MSSMVGLVKRAVLAGAVLGLVLANGAEAQLPEGPIGKWWKRPRVVEALKITPDQQQRLEEIFGKNRRSFIDLRADVEKRQLDLDELMAKKDSEPRKVSAAVDSVEQAKLRLRKAHAMMVLEMREILTADQWRTLLDKAEEARQFREDRRAMRHGAVRGREPGVRATPRPGEKADSDE